MKRRMDIPYLEIGLSLVGLVIANYGAKFVRIYPLLNKALEFGKDQAAARKDGVLTQKEKADLYDGIEGVVKEIHSVVKGFFPNKSK